MEILFTTTTGIGSKLIRLVTGESISHVALLHGNMVLHSKLTRGGVVVDTYGEFLSRGNRIIYRVPTIGSLVWGSKYRGAYDVGALLYLGLRLIGSRYLGIPMPKVNLWQSTGMFLCTEYVSELLGDGELSMLTPGQLRTKLLEEL